MITSNKYFYIKSKKFNSCCLSCSLKGKPKSDKHKENLSKNHANVFGSNNPFYNKHHTDETKKKLHDTNCGIDRFSNEKKRELSIKNSGCGNPFYGKTHSEDVKKFLSLPKTKEHIDKIALANTGKVRSEEYKKKMSEKMKGKKHSAEHNIKISLARKGDPRTKTRLGIPWSDEQKKKCRISHINRRNLLYGGADGVMYPNVGLGENKYFRKLELETGWDGIYHGKSNKQFYLNELGYFVDYYEPTLNIVIEYDETKHYDKNWNLKEKDVIRQREIKNYLKCKFYRYIKPLQKFYEV